MSLSLLLDALMVFSHMEIMDEHRDDVDDDRDDVGVGEEEVALRSEPESWCVLY